MKALNGLCSGRPQPLVGETAEGLEFMSAQQRQIMLHVERSVRALGLPPGGLRPAEALSALRAAGCCGGHDADHLGSCQLDEVSLPADGACVVPLAELWGPGGQCVVDDFIDHCALVPDTAGKRLGLVKVYEDPALQRVPA